MLESTDHAKIAVVKEIRSHAPLTDNSNVKLDSLWNRVEQPIFCRWLNFPSQVFSLFGCFRWWRACMDHASSTGGACIASFYDFAECWLWSSIIFYNVCVDCRMMNLLSPSSFNLWSKKKSWCPYTVCTRSTDQTLGEFAVHSTQSPSSDYAIHVAVFLLYSKPFLW